MFKIRKERKLKHKILSKIIIPSSKDEKIITSGCNTKEQVDSVLKHLELKQLENLNSALDSKGGDRGTCTYYSKTKASLKSEVETDTRSLESLFCKAFRWPEIEVKINNMTKLKRSPNCVFSNWYSGKERTKHGDLCNTCINPYHLSRHENLERCSPYLDISIPNHNRTQVRSDFIPPPTEPEVGYNLPRPISGKPTSVQEEDLSSMHDNWCTLAYWEMKNRVGDLFPVTTPTINFFNDLPQGDGMCVSVLKSSMESANTKTGIGYGITLALEEEDSDEEESISIGNQCKPSASEDHNSSHLPSSCESMNNNYEPNLFSKRRKIQKFIWLFNRSENPIFVHSPTLDPTPRDSSVHKLLPGHCMRIFNFEIAKRLGEEALFTRYSGINGPYNSTSITISFVKGWGQKYKRQWVTSCPCWLEVLVNLGTYDNNNSNLIMRSTPALTNR